MNIKLTASLLIVAAVLANVAFAALGSIFGYPDVLNEPVAGVLADFRAEQTAVAAWFTVLALSAALFAPIAIGVRRLSSSRALGRRYAGGWFVALGAVSAALVLVGVLSPLGLTAIDTANFIGYIMWSMWLIAFAIVIMVHEHRAGAARPMTATTALTT